MKSYNLLERQGAKALDALPQLKQIAKTTYQSLNYLYFGKRGFQLALHPQVQLLTPLEWAGIKSEPEQLFFGYYDKSPFSTDMRRSLFHRLNHDGNVEIVLFDQEQQTSKAVGISSTWSSQQGSMVQWIPGNYSNKLIFNDLVDKNLSARIVNLETDSEHTIPYPIQTLNPNGKQALTLNYKRLDSLRPEYGYAVAAENFSPDQLLEEDGIWKVDLESGEGNLILSLAKLAENQPRSEMVNSNHKVNHIMYSPAGTKFVFMHRWIGSQGKFSRLYVANNDSSDLCLLLDDRMVSHYSWRDEEHLLVWARTKEAGDHYYLINVITGKWEIIGEGILDTFGDGHPSFSPDRRWIITDTYPDRARQQHLLLYEVETGKIIEIGRFLAPLKFNGPKRCDLHPRWSPDGKMISIDSCHEGKRMTYFLDISSLVNN